MEYIIQGDDEIAQLIVRKIHASPYGYTPTFWICILYVVLFGVTTVLHIFQTFSVKPRLYWLLPTIVCCGLCEALGWGARLWSSKTPLSVDAFLMQITTTIIAPTFLTAAFYTILGKMIPILGSQYSRLSPKAYLIVFISADVIALVVQAVGGGKASTAFQRGRSADPGSHIMLAGIFLQMAGILLYLLLSTEFLLRYHFKKPLRAAVSSHTSSSASDPIKLEEKLLDGRKNAILHRMRLMLAALFLATTLVLIRSIYRSIELIGGWRGRVITTEKYFNILDGAPIVLAMFLLNILHPGILLRT